MCVHTGTHIKCLCCMFYHHHRQTLQIRASLPKLPTQSFTSAAQHLHTLLLPLTYSSSKQTPLSAFKMREILQSLQHLTRACHSLACQSEEKERRVAMLEALLTVLEKGQDVLVAAKAMTAHPDVCTYTHSLLYTNIKPSLMKNKAVIYCDLIKYSFTDQCVIRGSEHSYCSLFSVLSLRRNQISLPPSCTQLLASHPLSACSFHPVAWQKNMTPPLLNGSSELNKEKKEKCVCISIIWFR